MENELNKALDDIVHYIKNGLDYKMCLKIQKQMEQNEELMKKIEDIKSLQKKYVKSNYDDSLKEELKKMENSLNEIPLYVMYQRYLANVNEQISYVEEEINQYFTQALNEKIE